MKDLRIIIAGGRDFNDYELLKTSVLNILAELSSEQANGITKITLPKESVEIISGTARGADALGERFAAEFGLKVVRFPANWNKYKGAAGPIRNGQMADYAIGKTDGTICDGMLIAFYDGNSPGTTSMIEIAERKGLIIHVIRY